MCVFTHLHSIMKSISANFICTTAWRFKNMLFENKKGGAEDGVEPLDKDWAKSMLKATCFTLKPMT